MLSSNYRLRLESICKDIASGTEVSLEDMMWASKLAKANTSAFSAGNTSVNWSKNMSLLVIESVGVADTFSVAMSSISSSPLTTHTLRL